MSDNNKELFNLVNCLVSAQLNLAHYQCEVAGMNAANLAADIANEDVVYVEEDFKKVSHVYHTRVKKAISGMNNVQGRRNTQHVPGRNPIPGSPGISSTDT